MKLFKLSLLFCVASLLTSPLLANGTDCQNVAKQVKYIKPEIKGLDAYLNLRFGPFKIKVPPGYKEIVGMMDSSMIVVVYPSKSLLVLSVNPLGNDSRFKDVDITQLPNIIFLKTKCDPLPKNETERALWEIAFAVKSSVFEENSAATVTKSGRLTYYLHNDQASTLPGKAYIVDKELKNNYLTVEARGISYEDFKRIIFNIAIKTK